jgi:hypothetical protein
MTGGDRQGIFYGKRAGQSVFPGGGRISRAGFVMDRIIHRIGLRGKIRVPGHEPGFSSSG